MTLDSTQSTSGKVTRAALALGVTLVVPNDRPGTQAPATFFALTRVIANVSFQRRASASSETAPISDRWRANRIGTSESTNARRFANVDLHTFTDTTILTRDGTNAGPIIDKRVFQTCTNLRSYTGTVTDSSFRHSFTGKAPIPA